MGLLTRVVPGIGLAVLAMGTLGGPATTWLPLAMIVPGAVVTQPFGCTAAEMEPMDSSCAGGHFHSGVDLAAPPGTPVYAAAGGSLANGIASDGCGLYARISVDGKTAILYCHLSQTVDPGPVLAGSAVGAIGSTGNSTGPHLHLEVQRNGRAVDPVAFLSAATRS